MTSEMPMVEYPHVHGLVIEVVDDEAITCRYIRGLQNPVWGGPDLAVAGDSIVALYVDTNPVLADLIADLVVVDDPVIRFDGVLLPQPSGLVSVCALSRPRAKVQAGVEFVYMLAGWMAEEELVEWPQLRGEVHEVQVTIDTSARSTRRTSIQFSRFLAVSEARR